MILSVFCISILHICLTYLSYISDFVVYVKSNFLGRNIDEFCGSLIGRCLQKAATQGGTPMNGLKSWIFWRIMCSKDQMEGIHWIHWIHVLLLLFFSQICLKTVGSSAVPSSQRCVRAPTRIVLPNSQRPGCLRRGSAADIVAGAQDASLRPKWRGPGVFVHCYTGEHRVT